MMSLGIIDYKAERSAGQRQEMKSAGAIRIGY